MNGNDYSSSALFGDFGAQHLRGIRQALRCSICLQSLNNPQVADCSHYFCASCIAKMIISLPKEIKNKNSWPCPLCKAPIKRRALKEDLIVKQLVESFEELAKAFQKVHQQEAILSQDPDPYDFSSSYLLPNLQLPVLEQTNTDNVLDGFDSPDYHISHLQANNYADELVSASKSLEKQIFSSSDSENHEKDQSGNETLEYSRLSGVVSQELASALYNEASLVPNPVTHGLLEKEDTSNTSASLFFAETSPGSSIKFSSKDSTPKNLSTQQLAYQPNNQILDSSPIFPSLYEANDKVSSKKVASYPLQSSPAYQHVQGSAFKANYPDLLQSERQSGYVGPPSSAEEILSSAIIRDHSYSLNCSISKNIHSVTQASQALDLSFDSQPSFQVLLGNTIHIHSQDITGSAADTRFQEPTSLIPDTETLDASDRSSSSKSWNQPTNYISDICITQISDISTSRKFYPAASPIPDEELFDDLYRPSPSQSQSQPTNDISAINVTQISDISTSPKFYAAASSIPDEKLFDDLYGPAPSLSQIQSTSNILNNHVIQTSNTHLTNVRTLSSSPINDGEDF